VVGYGRAAEGGRFLQVQFVHLGEAVCFFQIVGDEVERLAGLKYWVATALDADGRLDSRADGRPVHRTADVGRAEDHALPARGMDLSKTVP
jgi:hypothetical protein